MLKELTVCYSYYFEKSYKPCDQWVLGEFVLAVAVVAIAIAIAFAASRQAKGH